MRLTQLLTQPWAISEDGYRETLLAAKHHNDVARFKSIPDGVSAFHQLGQSRTSDDLDMVDGVAVIPIMGGLTQFSYWDGDRASYEWIGNQLSAALESAQVDAIVLAVDSPGGEVAGCESLASAIFAARDVKPITAIAVGDATSAGYWLASSASGLIASRTSILGSIGVRFTTLDFSKMDEAMGIEEITIVSNQSPGKDTDPATAEGRDRVQSMLDAMAEVFIADVARNRGVSRETVINDFGSGWVLVGESAVGVGMADGLGTLAETISSTGASAHGATPLANVEHRRDDMETVKVADITSEFLAEHCPKVVATIRESASVEAAEKVRAETPDVEKIIAESQAQGAASERARILAIQEAGAGTGNDKLVAELVADSSVTVEAAQARLFQATKASLAGRLDALKGDEAATDAPGAGGGSEVEAAAKSAAALKAAGDYAARHAVR